MRVRVPSPPGWGVGGETPLSCAVQVSIYFDTPDIYSNSIIKGNRPILGPVCATLTPHVRGVKIAFFAIALQRSVRLFCPLGSVFRYVFMRGLRPSRAAASAFPISGDIDTLGQKSEIAAQNGKHIFRHCIPLF